MATSNCNRTLVGVGLAVVLITIAINSSAQVVTDTVRVEAYIDGRSRLLMKQNTAQWHHIDWQAPGRWTPQLPAANLPTKINSVEWFPNWPDVPNAWNSDCNCLSDVFDGVAPPLAQEFFETTILAVQVRGTVRRWNPGPLNDFVLTIEFDDNEPGGADWYIVEIVRAVATHIEGRGGIPSVFSLSQNYPNPFNPSTTISYALPRAADVTLTVYDVLGRQVEELALGTRPAGTYEVSFDAADLPSGIYFYRLAAGDFVETKRMVVVK